MYLIHNNDYKYALDIMSGRQLRKLVMYFIFGWLDQEYINIFWLSHTQACPNSVQFVTGYCRRPSLMRPPYLPRNCGHSNNREVVIAEKEK